MALSNRDIIVIGASAGGVEALRVLVAGLAPDLAASTFVVLHLRPNGKSHLAPILERAGSLPVLVGTDGAPIQRGKIYVAPVDQHMMVGEGKLVVARGPRENRARPAINPLFRSAAYVGRSRVIGVILSGTLDDGTAGLWAVKHCGGVCVVQSDAAFEDMPRSARENVAIDHDVPLVEIAPLLNRLVGDSSDASPSAPAAEVVQLNEETARMEPPGFNGDEVGRRPLFTCPECHGALWELDEGLIDYRCHVGHAYSAEALQTAQNAAIEGALRDALRALKESAALDQQIAERSAAKNRAGAEAASRRRASMKMEQAAQLQEFLASLRAKK
jgi:two-component system chemotaxis response regulator CheB